MALVLWLTVFMRTPWFHDPKLELFWSYKKWLAGSWDSGRQILGNVAMFAPFGFLLSGAMGSGRKTCLAVFAAGFLFSATIEVLQLELLRGTFEYDDIFNNTLGALSGYLVYKFVEKLITEDYIAKTVISLGVLFVVAGTLICIDERDGTNKYKPVVPRLACFQAEEAELAGDGLSLSGFAFCNTRELSAFGLALKSVKTGREVKAAVTHGLERPDVAAYFNGDRDYSKSGYVATVSGIYPDEEYEIILKLDRFVSLPSDVFITGTEIHYTKQRGFVPPEVAGTDLEEIVQNGYLRVYRPDYACYVYQYRGCLYWLADTSFHFEKSGKTYIQYQLWTTQTDKLPQKRLKNKWYWDNIGGYFEQYEITDTVNCGKYRVCKRRLPTEYSVTAIVTGFYKNGKWVWQNYFRPVYEF